MGLAKFDIWQKTTDAKDLNSIESKCPSPDGSGNPFWITRNAVKRNLQRSGTELQKDWSGQQD